MASEKAEIMNPSVQSAPLLGNHLKIGLLRFTIIPKSLLIVPAVNKGNMLRGGFGHAFRRFCCISECRDARACPVAATCPYKLIFEPSPPPDADRLTKNQDIPRPFVFRPPLSAQTKYEAGQPFEFEMVLIARSFDALPYFVFVFRELAEGGLGLNRARCSLKNAEEITVTSPDSGLPQTNHIYSQDDELVRAAKGMTSDDWIAARMHELNGWAEETNTNDAQTQSLTIRFLTPTFIRADGRIIREPEFHQIFKRLRDRINALSTFYGDGPLDADFQGLGLRAEKVRKTGGRFEWIDRARTSTKTGQRHELSGFVGEAVYEGDFEEFLPWLALGEMVHVGRHTAWGNGWMEVQRTEKKG